MPHQDPTIGASILYRYPGIPLYKPRAIIPATVLNTRTTKRGDLELQVKAEGINLPKWIAREDIVSYLWNQNAPAFASAS